jgi:hypothetical protein
LIESFSGTLFSLSGSGVTFPFAVAATAGGAGLFLSKLQSCVLGFSCGLSWIY